MAGKKKLRIQDLAKIREKTKSLMTIRESEGRARVTVHMGTCGIAAGARDTMKAILDYIESESLAGIIVTQTGCIGQCEKEPIVQVIVGESAKVTYGKVNSETARRIMKEHVVAGQVVQDHVIPV
jgi:NADP-reducing hydrogenase subunit HndB